MKDDEDVVHIAELREVKQKNKQRAIEKRKKPDKRPVPKSLHLTSLKKLANEEIIEEEWLVDRLFPKVGCSFLTGPPKMGKTWLAYDLCCALISKQPFLTRKTSEIRRNVLYLAGEGNKRAIRKRLIYLCNGREIDYQKYGKRLRIAVSPEILLDEDHELKDLRKVMGWLQPAIVVIDPMSRFHYGDENSRSDMEPILTALRRVSEDFQCLILVVHHPTKANNEGNFDPLRGTSAFRAWHDSMIYLKPRNALDPQGTRELGGELRDGGPFGPVDMAIKVDEYHQKASLEISQRTEPDAWPGGGKNGRPRDADAVASGNRRLSVERLEELSERLLRLLEEEGPQSKGAIRKKIRLSGDDAQALLEYSAAVGTVTSRVAKNGKRNYARNYAN